MKLQELKDRLNKLEPEYLILDVEISNLIAGKNISTFLTEVTKDGLLKASETLVDMELELPKIYELWNAQGRSTEAVEQYVTNLGLIFHGLNDRPWGVLWEKPEGTKVWFTRYAGRNIKTVEAEL